MSRLRVANAVVSAAMLALFLVHGVGNVFQLVGMGTPLSKLLSWALVALCVVHAAIGVVLTVATFRAQREAGASYPLANARFWAIRLSGLLIAVLMATHVLIFLQPAGDYVRLGLFGMPQLVLSVLLVAAIAVHVLAALQPLLISLGIGAPAERAADVALALAILLALMVVGFVVYYVRWSAL